MSETNHLDNPAGRLYLAFNELRRGRYQKQETVRNILMGYYGLGTNEELMSHYAALCGLPSLIRRAAAQQDLPDEMTKHVPAFEERLMNLQLANPAEGQLVNKVEVAQLDGLETLSAYLSTRSASVVLTESQSDEIERLIEELESALQEDTSLPDVVTKRLEECVAEMRHALSLSRILGTDPLLAEALRSVGAFQIHRNDFDPHREAGPIRSFFELVGYVASVTELIEKANEIGIPDLLGLGAGA